MKEECDLEEIKLPLGVTDEAFNNIFVSKDLSTNTEKLLLIIQGSGAVRAGQWARALCINESVDLGSILPYLKMAKESGYAVVVFNPNLNSTYVEKDKHPPKEQTPLEYFMNPEKPVTRRGKRADIKENETPREHTLYVWDNICSKSPAKKICIVAHSAGGDCTLHLLKKRTDQILAKLKAVAFTDAVHSVSPNDDIKIKTFLQNNAINWVTSDKPLDTPVNNLWKDSGCTLVSAGHPKHEFTSGTSITSVFKFINSKSEN